MSHDHIASMESNLHKSKYQPHLVLDENTVGRDFVVSDLHGHRALLDDLLAGVEFLPSKDRLISVGDLVDRGPDSPSCLELLEEPWFWAVRGNHEQMLIDSVQQQTDALWSRWLTNGGSWALQQPEVQLNHWSETLDYLPMSITLPVQGKIIGICHAEYQAESWLQRIAFTNDDHADLIWGRQRLKTKNSRIILDVDWVFNGHTVVPDVTVLGNSVFIERGAYIDNPLTMINLQQWLTGH